IDIFTPTQSWTVDRLWSEEERIGLGIVEERQVVTTHQFIEKTEEAKSKIEETIQSLRKIDIKSPEIALALVLEEIFDLDQSTNNSSFTKHFVDQNKGEIPVYSTSKDG